MRVLFDTNVILDLFLDRALIAAERAADLAPQEAYILDTLAEVQYRLGLAGKAEATIREAIRLDPESEYYREQLRRYGDAWGRLTGVPVKERVIVWVRTGEEERVDG